MTSFCEFDHLVIGAHTLGQGAAFIGNLLGIELQPGGRHAAMGTHNLVLKLGARAYLEMIAIDPAGEPPARPRWFSLDDETTRLRIHEQPRLLTWAARTQNIDGALSCCPASAGRVQAMTRGAYRWKITIPDDGARVVDGLLPALIQWHGNLHPADNLDERGCELVRLEAGHPTPEIINPALLALGLAGTLQVTSAAAPRFAAIIRSPRGLCTITS
jgi:hypothetical protein